MSKRLTRNKAASIHQRLRNYARDHREGFDLVLTRYAGERLLHRLSVSEYKDKFILKGAMLFRLWAEQLHRLTRDLDLLGRRAYTVANVEQIFRDICSIRVEDDGLQFLAGTVRGEQILEEQIYGGVRIRLSAKLGQARVGLQVDIGYGDAVTPRPVKIEYPTMLPDLPAAKLLAYPIEVVVAEKFQAMVMLEMANSRMNDFYDLWTFARHKMFEGQPLCEAIGATFAKRHTRLPAEVPLAWSAEFSEDGEKQRLWKAFLNRANLQERGVSLSEVVRVLTRFLMPPTSALVESQRFEMVWRPGGPWMRRQGCTT